MLIGTGGTRKRKSKIVSHENVVRLDRTRYSVPLSCGRLSSVLPTTAILHQCDHATEMTAKM